MQAPDTQKILDDMTKKRQFLSVKNQELIELATKKAEAERDYKIAYARECMNLKLEKESITLIPNLAKGDAVVAELCYKADIADAVYRACGEKIKDIRLSIDVDRTELSFLKAELLRAD